MIQIKHKITGEVLLEGDFEWKYQPAYHTYWSCKKHGAVPITIKGIPQSDKPEDIIGEFENVLKAKLYILTEYDKSIKEMIKTWAEFLSKIGDDSEVEK